MSQHNFDDTLNSCLDLIQQGASIDDCLEQFPHASAELRPILELTAQMNMIEFAPPSIPAYQKGRNRLKATVQAKQEKQAETTDRRWVGDFLRDEIKLWLEIFSEQNMARRPRISGAALASILLVFSLFFSVTASADSLPGDRLYPVKTLGQQARIQLASSARKSAVIAEVSAKRADELEMVIEDTTREAIITLNGPVTRISDNTIVVEDLEIQLNAETVEAVRFTDGEPIEITVQLKNSVLAAISIDESDLEIEPVIEDEPEEDDSDADDSSPNNDEEVEEQDAEPNEEPVNNESEEEENKDKEKEINPNAGPGNNNGNGNTDPNPNAGPGNNSGNGNNDPNPNAGPGNNNDNGNNDPNPNAGPGNNNGNGNNDPNPNAGPGNNSGNGNNDPNPNAGPGNNNGNANSGQENNSNNNSNLGQENNGSNNSGQENEGKKDKKDKD